MKRAAVLFSGGTDSTCAAALLAEEGYALELLTFHDAATRGAPLPAVNASKLARRYGHVRHHAVDVDDLLKRLSYGRYARTLRRHGLLAAATPAFSSVAWHAAAARFCREHGVALAADGLTRELMHFPGHMDASLPEFRRLYAAVGVEYRNPVRDWPVPPDRQLLDRLLVDYHLPGAEPPARTTGRWLHERGLMPAPDVKGTPLDFSMQHDCYPFVAYNMLAFWHYLAREDYASFEKRVAALVRDKVDEALELLA